jgi:hypothetical protein
MDNPMKSRLAFFISGLMISGIVLTACGEAASPSPEETLYIEANQATQATEAVPSETPTLTATGTALPSLTSTPSQAFTPTTDTRLPAREWSAWPIVPAASAKAIDIYRNGIQLGVTPNTYSVVGDCQSKPEVFLGIYATDRYYLGKADQSLQDTINAFHNSFQHESAAVRDGLSAPSALDPLWADTSRCKTSESPLACELRLYKPMIVFVNLGTNWKAGASADAYEAYLRKIVDLIILNGAVPILTNKADNVEGDHSLNLATAKVAYDYDIPLMNFWLAADSLPVHGLDTARDNIYLTPKGWDVRNYVALRTLDSVWRTLKTATP